MWALSTMRPPTTDFARKVARAVTSGAAERGLLVCGSGVGASVAANKVPGIRAGLCHDTFSARQGVEDDAMNVLCLGARVIGPALAQEVVRAFLAARFSGAERHVRRVGKIKAIEEDAINGVFGRQEGKDMTDNPLKRLRELGQSVWYDYIRRDLITSGRLAKLIREDALAGMTSTRRFSRRRSPRPRSTTRISRGWGERKSPAEIFEGLKSPTSSPPPTSSAPCSTN
jgi:RpiB/LacA/LacB family sugar-phosphate isomerase